MKKALFLLICMVAVVGMAVPARAVELGVRGYYWFPTLDGHVKVDGNGIAGTTLDLKDDIGFDNESYPIVEAFAGFGAHHLSLSYYHAKYDGTSDLTRTINFDGKTYTVGSRINTDLKYDVYDATYQYDLLNLENILAGFSLGLVGKVKVIDGEIDLRSSTQSASKSFTAPVPMAGVNLHLGIIANWLEARVLATGMGYWDGSIFDAQADISLTPFPFLDIHGGYRTFIIDVNRDDVDFNYNTSGPYVAVTVSF
jgi:hypothetical protein